MKLSNHYIRCVFDTIFCKNEIVSSAEKVKSLKLNIMLWLFLRPRYVGEWSSSSFDRLHPGNDVTLVNDVSGNSFKNKHITYHDTEQVSLE